MTSNLVRPRDVPKREGYTMSDPVIPKHAPTPGPWTYSVHDTSCGLVWKIGPFNACIYVDTRGGVSNKKLSPFEAAANARLIAAAPDLLAALKEMGDWIAAGLQASDEAWPDERCLKHTEEIAARARAAVNKAEGRPGSCEKCGGSGRLTIYDTATYIGQPCSPIGDEPCPKCSPDGNAT
jgi:hypothetical protein